MTQRAVGAPSFDQAMTLLRPGFAMTVLLGSDEHTMRVVGEKGPRILLKGADSDGWWTRSDIAIDKT